MTDLLRPLWSDVFDVRLVVSADECPYEVWALHHRPTDMRARLFFSRDEAYRVADLLSAPLWRTRDAKNHPALLRDIDSACTNHGLEARELRSEETGELIAHAWGSSDVLHAVDAAEKACRK